MLFTSFKFISHSCFSDRLQFTVTSRTEMPNARFIKEIARAADDIYHLHTQVDATKAKL